MEQPLLAKRNPQKRGLKEGHNSSNKYEKPNSSVLQKEILKKED